MKRAWICGVAVFAVLSACIDKDPETRPSPTSDETAYSASSDGSSVDITCGTAQIPITVSSTVPNQPSFPSGSTSTIESIQCAFDVFSWNSFIALAHTADGSLSGQTVWETWPQSSDIFLPNGADPGPWPGTRQIPESCSDSSLPVVSQLGKRPDVLEATDEPFKSGPLVDVNGYFSRFMITINEDMYNEIRQDTLYSQAGQSAFSAAGNTVNFSCGCDGGSGAECASGGQQGALMVKAAWKVLAGSDDPSKFHTAEALVVTPAQDGSPETCEEQTLGLVGFHIAHKTQGSPQWVWSTFEQVSNVPTQGQTIPSGASYNYYQADCDDCNPVNEPPPQPWNPHDEPVTANQDKSQVQRVIPITQATQTMNTEAQGLLTGTVWANYELISTQWPTNASGVGTPQTPTAENGWCTSLNPTDKSGAPAPTFLGNTTLETYIQGRVPQASSSCINCHLNATMAVGQNSFSDFTYLLERAQ